MRENTNELVQASYCYDGAREIERRYRSVGEERMATVSLIGMQGSEETRSSDAGRDHDLFVLAPY